MLEGASTFPVSIILPPVSMLALKKGANLLICTINSLDELVLILACARNNNNRNDANDVSVNGFPKECNRSQE